MRSGCLRSDEVQCLRCSKITHRQHRAAAPGTAGTHRHAAFLGRHGHRRSACADTDSGCLRRMNNAPLAVTAPKFGGILRRTRRAKTLPQAQNRRPNSRPASSPESAGPSPIKADSSRRKLQLYSSNGVVKIREPLFSLTKRINSRVVIAAWNTRGVVLPTPKGKS